MKKITLVMLLVVVLSATALGASEGPSKFDIGVVNYFRYTDAVALDYTAYAPGVRMQLNIAPWFGVSATGIYDYFKWQDATHRIYISTDAVIKAPLGFFEPFIAFGPVYKLTLPTSTDTFGYNLRSGFDINFGGWFSLGVEGMLLAEDFPALIAGFATNGVDYYLDNLWVALALKAKF